MQDGVIDCLLDGEGLKVFGATVLGRVLAKDVVDEVVEAVTSNMNSLVGNRLPSVDVVLRNSLVLSQASVDLHCDVERLLCPAGVVLSLVEGLFRLTLRIHYASNLRLEVVPCLICEWSGNIIFSIVDDLVP